jgi:hypothetical protein
MYQTKVYLEQGGNRLVVASGGSIDIEAGGALKLGGTAIAATAAELNKLAGLTASTEELNILDGLTVSTEELNILDGLTVSTEELNILDGVTASAEELNILDGVTASAEELNILDGVTASAEELNILDGVTATADELNFVADVVAGAASAGKALVVDENLDLGGLRHMTLTGTLTAATAVLTALPAADPQVAGALWNDAGTLKVSAGA